MDDFLKRQSTELLVFSALGGSLLLWLFADLSWRYSQGRRTVAIFAACVAWAAGLAVFGLNWPTSRTGIEHVILRNGIEVGRSTPEAGQAVWAMAVAAAAGAFGVGLLVRGFGRRSDGTTGVPEPVGKR